MPQLTSAPSKLYLEENATSSVRPSKLVPGWHSACIWDLAKRLVLKQVT